MGNKKKRKYEGIFRANEKGYGFVEFEVEDMEDVFIPSKSVNGALNGDTVLINIFKPKTNERRAEGKIVKVLKRDKDTIVGIFQKSRNFGFVVPDDKKFDTDIFISKNKCLNARNNDKVVAKIIKYPENGKNAEGEIVEVLGNIDLAGVDMLSVIKEFDLPNEFPLPVTLEAMGIPQEIDKKDIKNRKDFRDIHPIFTIDGEDAKDLDDAVFVQKNEDGTYLLEVHIADVSYYVKEDSILDKEAIKRGTSVYMFDRVVPMLPFELSNGICSLNAGEDRFALSCIMEIDSSGNVISSDVCKSVIRVTERMSYTDVYKIITNSDEEIVKKYEKYISCFKDMEELAHILKDRRLKQGYLNLDIPESKIVLDGNGKAIEVKKYELNFANEIIEQFMLTANETVAEKFYWLEAPFIYRVHEKPELEKINEANKFLFNIGYKIKASKDNIRPKAFAEVLEKIKDTEYEKVISTLILRALKIARYEAENKGHFGIASKYYCHFTSPIRRYPDLVVHRLLKKYLIEKDFSMSTINYLESSLVTIAEHSSEREVASINAERDVNDMKMAEYMESHIGEEYIGTISSVTNFGFFVALDNLIEGLVHVNTLKGDYYNYVPELLSLIGKSTKKTYRVGDKIKIKVINASKENALIDFEIVGDKNARSKK